jgi:hypothetical protein
MDVAEFRQVCFGHPGRNRILDDFTLTLGTGEVLDP